ncbi:MAG: exonuclease domain-containing protein [Bacteroidota bacterium]
MYAVLDIESTGGKYNEEGIMEIAIYRFDGEETVDRFISLINPEREIQPFVTKLTGINSQMLRSAPKFHEVAKRIIEITEDAVVVAHNAQFDYRILRTEFRRLGYNYERKTLCTVDLSQKLLPDAESHSLGKLVRSLGIAVSDRHRANGDALATLKLLKLLLAKDLDKSITKSIVRAETLGELSTRQLDMVEALPTEMGIYYMYNKEGDLLFLGKTKNLKRRVNQHFTNQSKLARQLQKETKKVTFERTGNELAAILKEEAEIQKSRPKLNKRIPQKGFSHGIYIDTSPDGLLQLTAAPANRQDRRLSSFASLGASKAFLKNLRKAYALEGQNAEAFESCLNTLEKRYSIQNRSLVLLDKGRTLGERCVFLIVKGTFKGMGYTDLNHQINNLSILNTIITPFDKSTNTTYNIETYLRKNKLEMIELES